MLATAFPGVGWVGALVDVFSTLFFPIDGVSIGVAVFLLLLGAALARRAKGSASLAVDLRGLELDADALRGLAEGLLLASYAFSRKAVAPPRPLQQITVRIAGHEHVATDPIPAEAAAILSALQVDAH